jgi:hypothetical protein
MSKINPEELDKIDVLRRLFDRCSLHQLKEIELAICRKSEKMQFCQKKPLENFAVSK